MTAPASTTQPRTYGGWRRPISAGLGTLTLLPTAGLFAGLLLSLVVLLRGHLLGALVMAMVFLVALVPLVIRVGDRPAWRHAALRWCWWRATRTGSDLYRSGPFSRVPAGAHLLPGLLARSDVWTAMDTQGRRFALIHHPYTQQWTVVLGAHPSSALLISTLDQDMRVAHWGEWLAALTGEPAVEQVAVILDQSPDPGRVLAASVAASLAPSAPPFARQMMAQAAREYPTGEAEIHGYVSITFSGRRLRALARDPEQAAALAAREIGTRLPSLSAQLAVTGAGEGRPLPPDQLAATVRGWYDPAVRLALAETQARGQAVDLQWSQVGPGAAQETWQTYRHDSGLSRVLEMRYPPRSTVYDTVLQPLIAPIPAVPLKRVTLLYTPVPVADTPQMLDRQVRAAFSRANRRRSGLVPATDSAEVQTALQAAHEAATGAGVVDFSMLVTVTVDGHDADADEQLDQQVETVIGAARAARITLTPACGAQAAAFAIGLGVGLDPRAHSLIPAHLRDVI